MKKTILCGLTALMLGGFAATAQTANNAAQNNAEIELTRQKIADFVQTRQLIATRRTAWITEQEITQRRLEAFEREMRDLRAQITEAEQRTTQAERTIAERQSQIETLLAATNVVTQALPGLEDSVREIAQYFPAMLRSRTDALVRQLGRSRQTSERMSIVIGIMNEFDRFNSNFNLTTDQRTLPNGEVVVVNVMYIGMGIAFYANETGTVGGYGVPARGEWEWTADNSIAAAVRSSIAFLNNEVKPARLVDLPIVVTDVR
ncbi:MAG: DUF3450 domain-containing protein [Verrucomicrobia bacterium]|nr:DUF3450 domain-containing protein [Verrucomicrobiota bacterium]